MTIKVTQEGAGWSVYQDGKLASDTTSSGVHKTKGSAVRHADRIAKPGEAVIVDGGRDDVHD